MHSDQKSPSLPSHKMGKPPCLWAEPSLFAHTKVAIPRGLSPKPHVLRGGVTRAALKRQSAFLNPNLHTPGAECQE